MRNILFRGIAFYIDGLFFSILTYLTFFIHHYFIGDIDFQMNNFNSFSLMPYHFFCYFIYFYVSESLFECTIGKKIFGFRVVKKDGSNEFSIFFRTLIRIIPFNQISFLFNEKKTFWHESWSKVFTVKL